MRCDRFQAERREAGADLNTCSFECTLIKQMLKWCVSRELIDRSPLPNYKIEKPAREPKPSPAFEELQRILRASTSGRRVLLQILAFTGVRSGEMQRLLKEDVDLESGWIHVRSRPMRSPRPAPRGRSRSTPC